MNTKHDYNIWDIVFSLFLVVYLYSLNNTSSVIISERLDGTLIPYLIPINITADSLIQNDFLNVFIYLTTLL